MPAEQHKGDRREFTHLRRAWYGPHILKTASYTDQVTFGLYSPGGGTSGEMQMRWVDLGGGFNAAKLEVFEDAWSALAQMPDVLCALEKWDSKKITPEQFCRVLLKLGFRDATEKK